MYKLIDNQHFMPDFIYESLAALLMVYSKDPNLDIKKVNNITLLVSLIMN